MRIQNGAADSATAVSTIPAADALHLSAWSPALRRRMAGSGGWLTGWTRMGTQLEGRRREGASLRTALLHGTAGGARNREAGLWFSAALRLRAPA